jgi:membrane-associated phospholipid phosphatase
MSASNKLRKTARAVTKAEAQATRAVAPRAGSAPQKVAATIGKLGDQPPLRTLSAIVVAGGLSLANRRLVRAGVRMLLAHELATLGKNFVKDQFNRTRPHSAKSHRQSKVKRGRNPAKSETSFPSGHSAGATAVARAFGREFPDYQTPALAAAAAVAGMQVPRLNHYPTDIAAGMLLGVISEAGTNLLFGGADKDAKPAGRGRPRRRA